MSPDLPKTSVQSSPEKIVNFNLNAPKCHSKRKNQTIFLNLSENYQ